MHEACIQDGRITGLERDMENMNGWQKSQNGSILRVEEKVDKLIFWQMSTGIGFGISILLGVIAVVMNMKK